MKRKRIYDIDDPRSTHHHSTRNRNHYYSNRNDNHQQRNEEPVNHEQERMSRIRQLLVRIGERSSSTLAHNLDQLSTALLVDIEHYRTFIISTLFECIVHLSIKIPIYATLVGLINHVKQDFGKEIIKTLTNEIILSLKINNNNKSIIKTCSADQSKLNPLINFNRIRLLLRFCVCLYNANIIEIISIENIIKILNKIIINENISNYIKQYICYIIITILIWCDNSKDIISSNEEIINNLNNFINKQNEIPNPYAFKPFKNVEINLLYNIWTTYKSQAEQQTNDLFKCINRPYLEFQRLKKKYKHTIDITKIETEISEFKEWENNNCNLLPLWLEFGIPLLLDTNTNSNNTGTNTKYTMEEYIISDYIHDIIFYFSEDPKLCSEQLINLQSISSFESKYIIVSGIIFKMFSLPYCKYHYIFFGKIIIELFRKQTKVWPRVIGPIVNIMFHNIENIDIECRYRFCQWFSFHLANFNFQWPWENWSNIMLNTSDISSKYKKLFISNVMLKCIHLSYYDRFKKTLPNDILNNASDIIPNKPESNYEYKTNEIYINLLRMLNQRQAADDIYNHLETHELNIFKQIKVLFLCILHVGKSSCSHVLSFLKMYGKKPLKELLNMNNDAEKDNNILLLECLFEYWCNSPIRIEILCDKLHAMNYITPENIIKFIFLKENLNNLYLEIYWIIITQSLDRIIKTTQGMKRGIDKFINDIQQLNKNLNSDFNDQDMIIQNKQNKEKQLNQLKNRLNNTNQKISNIFILFFKQSIKILYYLIDNMNMNNNNNNENKMDIENNNNNNNNNEGGTENDNKMDNDDDEMDDDMLMSENWAEKHEKIEKEKQEKAKNIKNEKININKYLFDIINQRMIEIARRFYTNIDINTWNILENDIFKNIKNSKNENENENDNKNDNNNKYYQQINHSLKSIIQIKQLLL